MFTKRNLQRLKLIVFDLDGTLLSDDNSIGDETRELVNELKSFGVKFSFATGRLHSAIIGHAETLGLNNPLISLDGSLIKNYPSGEVIFESGIPLRHMKKAVKYADNLLLKFALCHGDAIYYTELNSSIPDMLDKFGATYVEINDLDCYLDNTLEFVVASEMRESVRAFHKRMMFPYMLGISTSFYKSHRRGDLYYVEARKSGTDKGTGLKRLSKHLKIQIDETAVMGDWYNDRELFKTGALSIAVQNAVNEIKYHSNYITKRTNNEDAAAEFLKMVLEAKKQ
ncbi:MAG: HAD family hydrolase [Melioribacteraceae bacterium]|nr:HAD family hydrolase [Melioribacteraceae bacterium]